MHIDCAQNWKPLQTAVTVRLWCTHFTSDNKNSIHLWLEEVQHVSNTQLTYKSRPMRSSSDWSAGWLIFTILNDHHIPYQLFKMLLSNTLAQNDFHDGSLAVPGASAQAVRIAKMIRLEYLTLCHRCNFFIQFTFTHSLPAGITRRTTSSERFSSPLTAITRNTLHTSRSGAAWRTMSTTKELSHPTSRLLPKRVFRKEVGFQRTPLCK